MAEMILLKERVLGGTWGAVVGDAPEVPVEFTSREEGKRDPARNAVEDILKVLAV